MIKIIETYRLSNGIYGAPRIVNILNKQSINISLPTVSRYMKILGIKSIVLRAYKRKNSKLSDKEKPLIVNLIKHLKINEINQVWTTDITYIKTINDGNLYLISFIDMFSKKVVSWGLYRSQTTDEILKTLKIGIMLRKPKNGLIIHSDKGVQFRSAIYRIFLSSHNIIQSFTSLNHSCDENASQESFHASLKKEKLYQIKLYNYQDAYNAIYEYIEGFYNPVRTHSSIGYNSPNDFEKKNKN